MNKLPGKSPISTIVATLFLFAAVTAFIAGGQIEKNTSHRAPATSTPTPSKTFIRKPRGLVVPTPGPLRWDYSIPMPKFMITPTPTPRRWDISIRMPEWMFTPTPPPPPPLPTPTSTPDPTRGCPQGLGDGVNEKRMCDEHCDSSGLPHPYPHTPFQVVRDSHNVGHLICCIEFYQPTLLPDDEPGCKSD
jgi:hypothetical protein